MEGNEQKVTWTKEDGKDLWHVKIGFGFSDDNKKYLMAGISVAVSVFALCGGKAFSVLLGIVAAVMIAFCKECFDHYKCKLDWDWADVVWMIIGGFVGGVISTVSYALWN